MKTLFVIALSMLLATPAFSCEEHAEAAVPASTRAPASVASLAGDTAKVVYDRLPGEPDADGPDATSKEGDLICYRKGKSYSCSVRGEDEENGRFAGVPAKRVFDKLPKEGEYEDGKNGIARESEVKCTKKADSHSCELLN